jgi:hypothetical protein
MKLKPISLRAANAYVAEHHRHSKPTRGHKFSISVVDDQDQILGVVIVGRPVARGLDDGTTAEVLRLCTTGERNVCSMLYGAARRAAKAMGYQKVVTYIREDEDGASLKASGYYPVATVTARDWDTPARRRDPDHHEVIARVRWETT